MAMLSSPLALIQSVPPVTRVFTAATITCSALYGWMSWRGLGEDAAHYMTLIPGSSLFSPWSFFTSAFVETSFLELALTLVFVPASMKYLERLWGSLEIVKFIVASVVASNIIAFGFNWIEFVATGNAELFLYGMHYHGQTALQIAFMVAFTQLMPEHQVQFLGVIKTRVKTLPMIYLTVSTVLCFIGFQCPWIVIQFGWYVSWVYLRFYKKNPGDSVGGDTYGDRSETFSLISWFPPFIHYPLTLLGNFVFNLANRFHLIPSSGVDIESGVYGQVPGSARAEAERRRALALKALDQRLANTSSPAGPHPANANTSQAPRAPISRSDSPVIPSSPPSGRAHDRKKSIGESDLAESGKPNSDIR